MKTYRVRYQTIAIGGLDVHLRTLRDLGQHAHDRGAGEPFRRTTRRYRPAP
ncbi:MAG TPA: hypothetical protein VIS76_08155 [Pseudomonadales bacterium]